MSINLAEVNQKVMRLITNMSEQNKKFYDMFYNPEPLDVQLPQINEEGELVTVTIPNMSKIMQENVGSVKHLMNSTVYVDAENGDDNNEGSEAAPFETIKKAIEESPPGSERTIFLRENQTHPIANLVHVMNKSIRFVRWGSNFNMPVIAPTCVILNNLNFVNGLHLLGNCSIDIESIKIQMPQKADNMANWIMKEFIVAERGSHAVNLLDVYVELNVNGASLINFGSEFPGGASMWVRVQGGTIMTNNAGYVCELYEQCGGGLFISGAQIDNAAYWVNGVIVAADGEARNLLTNITLP